MIAVIGLGSNIGDRLATLREAVRRLDEIAPVRARSHIYESAPVGDGPPLQGPFLNAAALVEWSDTPRALLDALHAIEHAMGRVRVVHHGARTIDLDILFMGDDVVVDDPPHLIVPHAHLHERAFAIAPLLDLLPDAINPRTKTRYVIPAGDVARMDRMDLLFL